MLMPKGRCRDTCWYALPLNKADNMGFQPHLIHEDVIKQTVTQHPRLKWSGCFSKTIKAEIEVRSRSYDALKAEALNTDSAKGETVVSYHRSPHFRRGCC